MKVFTVLFAVFAAIAAQESSTKPNSTPDPDFICKAEGFYPHPENCNEFYSCTADGAAYLFHCDANLLFNPVTGLCDWPENVYCDDRASERTIFNQECIGTSDEYSCVGVENQAYPHPELCDYYYDCYNDIATLCRCLDGWLFDLTYRGCNYPEMTDCGNRTLPGPGVSTPEGPTKESPEPTKEPPTRPTNPGGFVCPADIGIFPNPTDCSSFFNCVGGIAFLESCPGSLVFNPDLLICDYLSNVPSCQTTSPAKF